MATFNIDTSDKPHLEALLKSDKAKGMEVIKLCVSLMDETAEAGWAELPELFGGKLTLADLVKGVLHGALDLKKLNPDAYNVFKEEIHPFAMLMPRKNPMGETVYWNWRDWYRLDPSTPVNQETIETIIRRLLRYYRYVDVESLARALISKQVKTYEGLGERNVKVLPFYPALRYQQQQFGDLHVGKFYDDTGYFDAGIWEFGETDECPACNRHDIVKAGQYRYCKACNSGFKEVEQ